MQTYIHIYVKAPLLPSPAPPLSSLSLLFSFSLLLLTLPLMMQFVDGKYQVQDKKKRSISQREFDLEEEHKVGCRGPSHVYKCYMYGVVCVCSMVHIKLYMM